MRPSEDPSHATGLAGRMRPALGGLAKRPAKP
ncbi:MAG: hypothetical protein JWN81_1619, partial [Solirubrobacterales bacterium]|nr:hypothetical protein [Solirubrobacterales bacterium]